MSSKFEKLSDHVVCAMWETCITVFEMADNLQTLDDEPSSIHEAMTSVPMDRAGRMLMFEVMHRMATFGEYGQMDINRRAMEMVRDILGSAVIVANQSTTYHTEHPMTVTRLLECLTDPMQYGGQRPWLIQFPREDLFYEAACRAKDVLETDIFDQGMSFLSALYEEYRTRHLRVCTKETRRLRALIGFARLEDYLWRELGGRLVRKDLSEEEAYRDVTGQLVSDSQWLKQAALYAISQSGISTGQYLDQNLRNYAENRERLHLPKLVSDEEPTHYAYA